MYEDKVLLLTRRTAIPGFGITMGFTALYLSLIALLPLSALFVKSASQTWSQLWATVSSPRAVASYELTFGASALAAGINTIFGTIVAWTLVRYRFRGRKIIDALVDLPFALPTAVAGITLTAIYSRNGWIGRRLEPFGIHVAFTRLGVVCALTFIGLPFVIRTLQPVIQELDAEAEEAAASLGASSFQTFVRVTLPALYPALLTGFTLAFARAIGEYGSVVFISGNMPMRTEISTLLIMTKLEQYEYASATSLALVMLLTSFLLLLGINLLQAWTRRQAV